MAIYCQNLVFNGSFEMLKSQSVKDRREASVLMHHAEGWYCGSDLGGVFNENFVSKRYEINDRYTPVGYGGKKYHGIPYNLLGYQHPRTGRSYAGLTIIGGSKGANFTQSYGIKGVTDTVHTLLNKKYYCEFFISVGDQYARNHLNTGGITSIGAHITNELTLAAQKIKANQYYTLPPQILNSRENCLNDTLNWIKIYGYFDIETEFDRIIVSAFYLENKEGFGYCTKKAEKNHVGMSFYVDDLLLLPVDSIGHEIIWDTIKFKIERSWDTISKDSTFKSGEISDMLASGFYRLQETRFEPGLFALNLNNTRELNELASWLLTNKEKYITIEGHTCNTGSEQSNIWRSTKRTYNIKEYLVRLGVQEERIIAIGKGSSEPIAHNNSELSRARNNRIIIRVL